MWRRATHVHSCREQPASIITPLPLTFTHIKKQAVDVVDNTRNNSFYIIIHLFTFMCTTCFYIFQLLSCISVCVLSCILFAPHILSCSPGKHHSVYSWVTIKSELLISSGIKQFTKQGRIPVLPLLCLQIFIEASSVSPAVLLITVWDWLQTPVCHSISDSTAACPSQSVLPSVCYRGGVCVTAGLSGFVINRLDLLPAFFACFRRYATVC